MDRAEQTQVIHEMVAERGAPGASRAIEALAPLSRPLAHYLGGLAAVARQNAVGGGINFLEGRVSVGGFPSYFLVALLAKSTVAFLLVLLLDDVAVVVGDLHLLGGLLAAVHHLGLPHGGLFDLDRVRLPALGRHRDREHIDVAIA